MKPGLAFVIAHFHSEGRLASDLLNLIQSLSQLTRRIVFVSTGLSAESAEKLRPFAQVIVRENIGYDFWSYKVGIQLLGDLTGIDRLVIFNSSFITLSATALCAPFIGPVDQPCLHGLTRCDFGRPHLQSFWVAFEHRDLIRSSQFERWWHDMTPVSERLDVIDRYEMGMSAYFSSAGMPIKAAFEPKPDEDVIAICRMMASRWDRVEQWVDQSDGAAKLRVEQARRLNPTHFLWDALLSRHGILKIELLKSNPFDIGMKGLNRLCEHQPAVKALIDEALAN